MTILERIIAVKRKEIAAAKGPQVINLQARRYRSDDRFAYYANGKIAQPGEAVLYRFRTPQKKAGGGGPLTVLALDQGTVREIMAMDPHAALEFLQLLCRLVASRLREIDEKVIGWRIMSGERNESVSA